MIAPAVPDLRPTGTSGLRVSAIGLGCNNFGMRIGLDAARDVVHAALDAGVTLFDTADVYGGGSSEEMLGACLAGVRDRVVIATKFGGRVGDGPYDHGASRQRIRRACEASLRRLGTDVIDLYFLHQPDPLTPFEETLTCVDDLVRDGKVRYFAFSNLPAWQIADLAHLSSLAPRARPAVAQVEWNLLQRSVETDVVPACRHFGIGMMAFFPLASGLLTGKYAPDRPFPPGTRFAELPRFASVATPVNLRKVERLAAFAADHGRSIVELAVAWLLAQPGVCSVLTGATSAEQARQNAKAGTWQPSLDDLAEIEQIVVADDTEEAR